MVIRINTFLISLLFLQVLSASYAPAQRAVPEKWTAQEAVHFALSNNPDAMIASRRIEATAADLKQAQAALYPQFAVKGEYARTDNPMYSFGNILNQGVFTESIDFNAPGVTDNIQLAAQFTYRLYNGGRNQAGLDAAAAQKEAAQLQEQAIHNKLGFAVVQSFYTIAQAGETVNARLAAVKALEASIQAAKARYDEGDLLKQDILNLEVEQAVAREDLIQAQHGLALAKRGFLNVLGLTDAKTEINLQDTCKQDPPLQADYHQRAEIKSMNAYIKAGEANLRIAQGGYYPTADAIGAYQYDKGFELDKGSGDSWMAAIRVNMTLFNGRQTDAEVERARANLAKTREKLRKLELTYDLEIRKAKLTLEQSKKRMLVTEKMIESAEESARLSRERFKEGLILSSELIDTVNRLTEAQVRNALASAEYHIAIADLRRASGMPQYSNN